MQLRSFKDRQELVTGVAALLREQLAAPPAAGKPRAIMLSGGETPLPAYELLAEQPPRAAAGLHVFLSDERLVPTNSPQSNYGRCAGLFAALGLGEDRALRVRTELPLEQAAARYDEALSDLCRRGTVLALGILGLGRDGHTASLFSEEDVRRGDGRLAIGIERPAPPNRVSVTPGLLQRIERLILVAAGADKRGVVARLQADPLSLPAGLAVRGARRVEIWADCDAAGAGKGVLA